MCSSPQENKGISSRERLMALTEASHIVLVWEQDIVSSVAVALIHILDGSATVA